MLLQATSFRFKKNKAFFGFYWLGKHGSGLKYVTCDDTGELTGVSVSTTIPNDRSDRVCLQLMPGNCLLRKLSLPLLSAKEIETALELWAEESLPEPTKFYYLDSWAISEHVRGLAAVPRFPLRRARQTLMENGQHLTGFRVLELCPPQSPGVSVVFHRTSHGTFAGIWKDQVLYDWQTFALNCPARVLAEQVAAACLEPPNFIYLDKSIQDNDTRVELKSSWNSAKFIDLNSQDPHTYHNLLGDSLAFDGYVKEVEQQIASKNDKRKLAVALSAIIIAGLFLMFSNVVRLEREVKQLQHQTSLLKVRANRSELVASRSGDALNKIRELRAMTTDRQGVMTVLKVLSDTLPPRTKLENFTIERDGFASLDGTAETELDVSTLLERFKRTALFVNPDLTFMKKDVIREDSKSLVRFRLETRLAQPMLILPDHVEETSTDQTEEESG